MDVLYFKDKLMFCRHDLQAFKRLSVSVLPNPCILLDRCQEIPLFIIPVITQRHSPVCLALMPSSAVGGPDKVLSIAHGEDNFNFRIKEIKRINKIDIQVGRIYKGLSFNPLMEIQHNHNPLFHCIEGIGMRICMQEILIQNVIDPELMVSTKQLCHGSGS